MKQCGAESYAVAAYGEDVLESVDDEVEDVEDHTDQALRAAEAVVENAAAAAAVGSFGAKHERPLHSHAGRAGTRTGSWT